MNHLLQRLSSLQISTDDRCANCNVQTVGCRSQCDLCSALSFNGTLCMLCSQVVNEFNARICYYHLCSMINENAIAYCSQCDDLLTSECDHNPMYLDCERANWILRNKYPYVSRSS